MEQTIRKMKIEDFETIMRIFDETDFGCIGIKELYKPGRQEQMLMMREVLRGESIDEKILVIEDSGQILGYAIIQESEDNWHIGQIAIDKICRGQGIGSFFMQKIQEMAKRCQRNISLECYEKDNNFFIKQGFQKVKEDNIETEYRWNYQKERIEEMDIEL